MRDDFAVFILTHGRAKQQKTVKTLKRCGYTGRLYLIVDDEDKELDEYIRLYGSDVITFSKREIEPCFDTMTNKKNTDQLYMPGMPVMTLHTALG